MIGRALIATPAVAVAVVLAYGVAAVTLSLIPVKGEPPAGEGIEVFVCTNGVHTDLMLPATIDVMDWTAFVPRADFPQADPAASHLSFGWGDRGFYVETRNWADLDAGTAWRALFGGGPSVMHVYYMASPAGSPDCGRLVLREGQYRRLAAFVRNSFQQPVRPLLGASYGGDDRFYPAVGSYGPFDTCNQWTARALKAAGVTMGLWTPLESGVMRWTR
ncbi:MAG TPA: TIGR02117 family protein [Azospirillum sp.]|nr:TIGR02117 family protein [Azospirillum sp.]